MTKTTTRTAPAGVQELAESDLAEAQGGLKIELMKAQITSYQLGVLDQDAPAEALSSGQQDTR